MIKVMFFSWHYATPEIFLETILKMTPGGKGIWKNIQAVTNVDEADYYIIIDGWNGKLPNKAEKAIYFGQHPNTPYSPVDKSFPDQLALLKFPLKQYLNPGEWWINGTYDELSAIKLFIKTEELACVATYQDHHSMYKQRQIFLREFVTKYPEKNLNIYGRPEEKYKNDDILNKFYEGVLGNGIYDAVKGEHLTGKEVICEYSHTLEFDVGPCNNYVSERFYDSVLMWCVPIYFGCQNISEYLPYENEAYYTFDINNLNNIDKVVDCTKKSIDYTKLGKVRDLLLNKYQTWGYTYFVVNHIDELKKDQVGTFEKWRIGEII